MPASTGAAPRIRVVLQARRAWQQLAVLVPLAAGVWVLYGYRRSLFGTDVPVRIAAGIVLLILGWASARAAAQVAAPALTRRGFAIAGPIGFVVRLTTL